jgi:hypothetical protein
MRAPILVALAATLLLPAVAHADPVAGPQRVVGQAAADAAAACRRDTPATDEQCAAVPLSPAVSEQAVADYQHSDVHRALQLQYELGNDVPFAHASWLGTHNSFNTSTREPTVSGMDANQQLSMTDQLRMDMRSLEVDAHWFPSAQAGGSYAAVACHARGEDQKHAGCTTEPLLADTLKEIATWLRANPQQVLLLYIEDHLETADGYAQGAAAVHSVFGDLLYAPGGTSCVPLPMDGTRNDVLAAGKQVLVISGCHDGAGWNGAIFSGEARAKDETGAAGYGEDGTTCDPARNPKVYDDHLLRVFEDSTALSATVDQGSDPITPKKAAALQRCAVDITGFDQLLPNDPRLAASIWSWAPGEPAATGDCAVAGADGRWSASPCTGRHAVACRAADGSWSIGRELPLPAARCEVGSFSTPRYGYEDVQLQAAMAAAHVDSVWLNDSRTGSTWTAHDTR